jgi:hypothetical protein
MGVDTLYREKKEAVMKRILLAVSALAIAGAAALTSANASQGAYAGDCRVMSALRRAERANLHAYA